VGIFREEREGGLMRGRDEGIKFFGIFGKKEVIEGGIIGVDDV